MHPITRLEVVYVGAHFLDYARRFVAQDARRGHWQAAFDDVQVTVTHTRGRGANQHLVRPGLVDLHLLEADVRYLVQQPLRHRHRNAPADVARPAQLLALVADHAHVYVGQQVQIRQTKIGVDKSNFVTGTGKQNCQV